MEVTLGVATVSVSVAPADGKATGSVAVVLGVATVGFS